MSKAITIYDIAKCLNISPATVSRALNDHPAVNEKTREMILATAYSLGYKSSLFSSNLKEIQRTSTIGLILPRLDSHFRKSVVAGVETIVTEAGYKLLFSQTLNSTEKEVQNAQIMFNSRVDGLLVCLSDETASIEHFISFLDQDIPVIFMERVVKHQKCLSVVIDNIQAAYKATSHLAEQGCRHIIFITGKVEQPIHAGRLKGYKYALVDNNLTFKESNLFINNLSHEAGTAAAAQILQMNPLPDGIFVSDDICAASCMASLRKAGIRVPEDMAVVGFSNDPVARVVEPTLTTIDYSGQEMGEVAAKNLIAQINNLDGWLDTLITDTIVLKSELLVRESSRRKLHTLKHN